MAETQNLSIHDSRFEEFSVPSLVDFVGGDRDEVLLRLIKGVTYGAVLC